MVIILRPTDTALFAHVVRFADPVGRDVGAVEEVAVREVAVGGEGAAVAVGDVEDVDAVVFFWFAAAGEGGVDVVAHSSGGVGRGGVNGEDGGWIWAEPVDGGF